MFVFFLGMVMPTNEVETKENENYLRWKNLTTTSARGKFALNIIDTCSVTDYDRNPWVKIKVL